MGNKQSVHHVSRRRSLVKEEFDFPQPTFDFFDDDWEVYHVEVELATLSPHTRHKIKVHVHEYTQEIISCEEECAADKNRVKIDRDDISVDQDNFLVDRDKFTVHRDKFLVDQDKFLVDQDKICLDQDKICLDQDKLSEKKPPDERGLTTPCSQDTPQTTAGRASVNNSYAMQSPSPARCSRCKRVLSYYGCSRDDVSKWNKNPDTGLPQDSASSKTPTDPQKEERTGTESVSNDMFLQWELSLEEPYGDEESRRKERNIKRRCGVSEPCCHGLDKCYTQNRRPNLSSDATPFREGTDPNATPVIATSLVPPSTNAAASPIFERTDHGATSSITTSSKPTSSNTTAASPTSNDAVSSVKRGEQNATSCACCSPRLFDTCSSSAKQSVARSLPVEIPTGSPTLYRTRPHLRTARRKLSDPVPRLQTTALCSPRLHSKERRVSLKGEPGWIPNPLDSDHDSEDMEDSGVFSDTTASSPKSLGRLAAGCQSSLTPLPARTIEEDPEYKTSPEPPLKESPTAADLARKRLALQTGRRRYNSEPTPVAPKTSSPSSPDSQGDSEGELAAGRDSRPSSVSGECAGSKSRSRWRLVKLVWGRRAAKSDAADIQPPPSSSDKEEEKKEEEEDLEKQLEWMTRVPNSEPPTPSEDRQAVDFSTQHTSSQDAPPRRVTFSEPRPDPSPLPQPSKPLCLEEPATSEDPGDADRSPAGQELELDWLCEPEWNNFELELFWSVLRPHMERLLQCGDGENMPLPCVALSNMDAGDHKMLDRCLLHVQWHIWKGNYCQAVSDFRAVRRHFRCCAESHLIQSETRDDVENLRLVFQRKRPSRFRFWI